MRKAARGWRAISLTLPPNQAGKRPCISNPVSNAFNKVKRADARLAAIMTEVGVDNAHALRRAPQSHAGKFGIKGSNASRVAVRLVTRLGAARFSAPVLPTLVTYTFSIGHLISLAEPHPRAQAARGSGVMGLYHAAGFMQSNQIAELVTRHASCSTPQN